MSRKGLLDGERKKSKKVLDASKNVLNFISKVEGWSRDCLTTGPIAHNKGGKMTEITIETLEENGVEVEDAPEARPVGRPKKEIDMDLVIAAHEGGYPAAEIVDLLESEGTSVCAATIRTRLKDAGFDLKKGARKIDILPEEISELYTEKGLTLAATADALEVSVVTLRSRMTEFGIETRPRGRRPDPTKATEADDGRTEVEFEPKHDNDALEGVDLEFTPFPSNPHLGTDNG